MLLNFPTKWVRCSECGFKQEVTTSQPPWNEPVVNDKCPKCEEYAVNDENS